MKILRRILYAVVALVVLLAAAGVIWYWRATPTKVVGAATRGETKTVQFYLFCGADINAFGKWGWHDADGQTPLSAAADYNQLEVVRLLIDRGADLNRLDYGTDYPQCTPLARAAMRGHLDACRVLLDAGANPNVPTSPRQAGDLKNWTALDYALQAKHAAVADLLRARGGKESEYRAQFLKNSPLPSL